jgi:signal recognition particle subunit SRP54
MREIRLALLEADVNFQVVKDFVRAGQGAGERPGRPEGPGPGQQVVKIVHEELTALMGTGDSRLAFGKPPTVILMAGLQGSGKTTTSAKLALLLRKAGKKPALVAADLQRPAAIDQLEQLGGQIQIPVYRKDTKDPVEVVKYGIQAAQTAGQDVVILDTAGRLHIDEDLMEELARVRSRGEADERAAGARRDDRPGGRQRRAGLPGARRLRRGRPDEARRDARGGAALSVRAVTGKPIKYVSVGEKLDQLEEFHPERMASRILGMGDVLTLIEKAEAAGRRGRAGGDGGADARRRLHLRRLPLRAEDAEEDGPAPGRAEDDPRGSATSSRTWTSTSASSLASRRSCCR